MIIPLERSSVVGTVARIVARGRLSAGYWDMSCIMGSAGAVSTVTVVARLSGGGATLATFSSSAAPSRMATQRIGLDAASDVEWVASNSSNSVGAALILEVSADSVVNSTVDVDVPISTDDALQVNTPGRRIAFVVVNSAGSPVDITNATSMAVIYQAPSGTRGEWPAAALIAPYEFGATTQRGYLFEAGLWRATGRVTVAGVNYTAKTKTIWVRA